MSDPFSAAKLGPLTLRNHIIKAATFEGRTPRRVVTDALIDFHRQVAAGGVGMSTVAYCAVSPDGGTDGRQILLGDASRSSPWHAHCWRARSRPPDAGRRVNRR